MDYQRPINQSTLVSLDLFPAPSPETRRVWHLSFQIRKALALGLEPMATSLETARFLKSTAPSAWSETVLDLVDRKRTCCEAEDQGEGGRGRIAGANRVAV